MNIAIIAVTYNRSRSLTRLLNSLEKAYYPVGHDITLIISVDKSETDEVEILADNYKWPHGKKLVDKHEKNLGLRPHMMSLGKWFEQYDAIVVLEDDLVVAPNYFTYTAQTVEKYHDCPAIAGISLYGFSINYQTGLPFKPLKDEHDAYFMNCAMSWGEVWMKDSWLCFYEWYLQHQDFPVIQHLPRAICQWNAKSWLKYHTRYCIEENKYFVHPYTSLTTNFSEAGEHGNGSSGAIYQVPIQHGRIVKYNLPDFEEKVVCYDGFFENKALYESLHLTTEEICLDLNREWQNRLHRRYWLTTEVQDYKIVRSFGLDYRPIEVNVLQNNPGNQVFLYDTQTVEANPNHSNKNALLYNYYIRDIVSFIRMYGRGDMIKALTKMATKKIQRMYK